MAELYRPSNGSEGASFIDKWCGQCERDKLQNGSAPHFDHGPDDLCGILGATFLLDVDHPEYPKEWIQDETGPRCTAFVPVGGCVPVRCDRTIDMFGEGQP
ncbi:hypothetical protein [Chitiniphilus eburneus]|uniref:hypothetical protein n=1 Tax=Chitiniphilus eburneus TaxID=2571148 RepID=UPI0035D1239A